MSDRLRVFVASTFVPEVEADLAAAFDATFAPSRDPAAALAGSDARFDALIVSLDAPLPTSSIEALPESVRAVGTYSVGTDHIDLDAARKRGIAVFNTPGVLADSTAENALLLMLGAARRATEAIDLLRSRRWKGWTPTQLVGVQLDGRRLGILGMGDIGVRVARRARALGMSIAYCNRSASPFEAELGAELRASPEELVADCDVLLLLAPSTSETQGIVDAALLRHARPGLIVVNAARGDLVVDDDLIRALQDGTVWAAGLDVFAGEPDVAPGYFELPNVFMLPHTGSSTIEARRGMGRALVEGLQSWAAGDDPSNRVA